MSFGILCWTRSFCVKKCEKEFNSAILSKQICFLYVITGRSKNWISTLIFFQLNIKQIHSCVCFFRSGFVLLKFCVRGQGWTLLPSLSRYPLTFWTSSFANKIRLGENIPEKITSFPLIFL